MTPEGIGGNIPRPESEEWKPAAWLNNSEECPKVLTLDDTPELHAGIRYRLWNKIEVVNCNSAGNYENVGTILVTLKNQQEWVL